MAKKPMILIINDQQEAVDLLRFQLEKERYQVVTALDGETGVKRARSKHPDLVLLDLKMPPSNSTDEGMRALKRLRDHDHDLPILILTAIGRKEEAVKAVQMGAFDFLRVEEIEEKLLIAVRNALDYRRLREENRTLRQTMERLGDVRIVGQSEKILTVLEMIGDVADSEATILVRGASGTGKELVSRFIHLRSRRRDEPFVTVNCAAIPSTLLESELFGYERGAFTGASRSKEGKFLLAHKGTIFLDEVGELHLDIQAKLLRVLEQREIEPLGGKRLIKVDIRVIAATNRNLEDAVASKQFREDLYYRLNVVPIELPTLRERREDIPLLLDYFLKKYSERDGKRIIGISPLALELIIEYPWPGNVRELENLIQRMVALKRVGEEIGIRDLPDLILTGQKEKKRALLPTTEKEILESGLLDEGIHLKTALEACERAILFAALIKTEGHKKQAAKLVGLEEKTFLHKVNKKYQG